ncbi:MAG: hypothetical protein ACI8WB_000197 [Phenylobacterium sp.]|jgi:hypothetical protein
MNFDTGFTPWFIISTAFMAFVQLVLAFGVFHEAEQIKKCEQKLWFLGSFFWFLITLSTGLVGAAVFWLIHFSTLKDSKPINALQSAKERRAAM